MSTEQGSNPLGSGAAADPKAARWGKARNEVVDRWRSIVDRIEARDEGGVLTLSGVMDEFCDEAATDTILSIGEPLPKDASSTLSHLPPVSKVGDQLLGRCLFCRGYEELGGCQGVTDELNRAVQSGRWDYARKVAQDYIDRLMSLQV
jgi:hypothetical protein